MQRIVEQLLYNFKSRIVFLACFPASCVLLLGWAVGAASVLQPRASHWPPHPALYLTPNLPAGKNCTQGHPNALCAHVCFHKGLFGCFKQFLPTPAPSPAQGSSSGSGLCRTSASADSSATSSAQRGDAAARLCVTAVPIGSTAQCR